MMRFLLAVSVLTLSSGVLAQEHHIYGSTEDLKWQQGPPGLPKGAEFSVLAGDPGAGSGSFVIRARLPAGYKVPPHSHPTAEQLTVLSGDLGVGLGDRFDEAKGQELKPGGFADLPGKMNHYVWTKNGAVIQVQGQSPFEITYANPAEDPRKQ